MEFSEVVRRRRMVRSYTDEPVERATIERMLHHATARTERGLQPGLGVPRAHRADDVERVLGGDLRRRLPWGDSAWLRGMRTAPAIVVPLSNKQAYLDRYAEPDKAGKGDVRWPVPYWHIDTGMAALLILQTAVDEGLGACFFGIPGESIDTFREAFDVPDDVQAHRRHHHRAPGSRRRAGLAGAAGAPDRHRRIGAGGRIEA